MRNTCEHCGQSLPDGHFLHRQLTPRENEVIALFADGLTVKEVGARLNISTNTAEAHKYNIYTKLNLHNLADLVKHCLRNGLTSLDEPSVTVDQPASESVKTVSD